MYKKKIVHIIVGLGDGGAERTLYNLVTKDKLNKHFVISLTDHGKYGKNFLQKKISVYSLGFKKWQPSLIKINKILKIIKKHNPDIIQTWMYHADFITIFLKIFFPKIKFIWGIRNTVFSINDSFSRWLVFKLCCLFSHLIPNLIISNSQTGIDGHKKAGYKNKFKLIYNGVNLKKFNSKKINKKTLSPVIGVVARYDKQKGYSVLLKSLEILKNKKNSFYCFCIGKNVNSSNKKLMKEIKALNLYKNVFLLGQKKNIENIYKDFDLLVLPSINGEGFPNVIIEAMACGIPCLVTDVGDSKIIVGKTGWVVPPNNYKKLSQNLESIFKKINSPEWRSKKKNCRARVVKKFSVETMVNNFQKIWNFI